MHLAINGNDLGRQRGGNESFILGLLQGIAQANLPVTTTVLTNARGILVLRSSGYRGNIIDFGKYHRVLYYLYQQKQVLTRLKPDWYLSTYFLPSGLPCPAALVVHDVSFRAHPGYFPAHIAWYMRILTGMAIKRARVVALDSEYTASEVQRYYPALDNKGVVTYPGVEERFRQPVPQTEQREVLTHYQLAPGYILAIGNIHPRKNMERLLEAYLLLRENTPAAPEMVWIGLPRWQSDTLVHKAEAAGVRLLGYVPAERLTALYLAASIFVYPSLYEGFGLPVLEAMTVGTPVVCSTTTSLPEVVGEAALTVAPDDTRAISQALSGLVSNPDLKLTLRERGYAQAAKFTYLKTAAALWRAMQAAG